MVDLTDITGVRDKFGDMVLVVSFDARTNTCVVLENNKYKTVSRFSLAASDLALCKCIAQVQKRMTAMRTKELVEAAATVLREREDASANESVSVPGHRSTNGRIESVLSYIRSHSVYTTNSAPGNPAVPTV